MEIIFSSRAISIIIMVVINILINQMWDDYRFSVFKTRVATKEMRIDPTYIALGGAAISQALVICNITGLEEFTTFCIGTGMAYMAMKAVMAVHCRQLRNDLNDMQDNYKRVRESNNAAFDNRLKSFHVEEANVDRKYHIDTAVQPMQPMQTAQSIPRAHPGGIKVNWSPSEEPITIIQLPEPSRIMLVPNGIWETFKRWMKLGQCREIDHQKFSPFIVPTYGRDLIANAFYNRSGMPGMFDPPMAWFIVYAYRWDSGKKDWDEHQLIFQYQDEGPESTAKVHRLVWKYLNYCGLRFEGSTPAQLKERCESVIYDFNTTGRDPADPGWHGMFPYEIVINVAVDTEAFINTTDQLRDSALSTKSALPQCSMGPKLPWDPEDDLATYDYLIELPEKDPLPLKEVDVHRLFTPSIKEMMRAMDQNAHTVGRLFEPYIFMEVSEILQPIMEICEADMLKYGAGEGDIKLVFPDGLEHKEGGVGLHFFKLQSSDVQVWFQRSTEYIKLSTTEQTDLYDVTNHLNRYYTELHKNYTAMNPILDKFYEYLPHFFRAMVQDGNWRGVFITTECFNQLKANTNILKEHHFVDETGKPYIFKEGDGHENFYTNLSSVFWVPISSAITMDFRLSENSIAWHHKDTNEYMRLQAFQAWRLHDNVWTEEWIPFTYLLNDMDEVSLRYLIAARMRVYPRQPKVFTKLSEIVKAYLPFVSPSGD